MVVPALLFLITLALLFVYARQLGTYGRHIRPQPSYASLSRNYPTVSVIIPARNEAANIGRCLTSLQKLDYPKEKLEIIVVDDQSEDETATIAASYPVTLIRSAPQPGTVAFKKAAISAGIAAATGEIIFTTDADCTVQPKWLSAMVAAMLQQKAMLVTGPVRMMPGKNFLSRFQTLDFAVLQGITAAAVQGRLHDMSSGANLAYYRKAFHDVEGFKGIDDIASGDDMLLMQKISGTFPGRVCYCFSRDAIVDTATENSWKLFLRQRIRWASKATRYTDKKLFRILLNVYLLNFFLFLMMCTCWMGIWPLMACLLLIAAKTAVEWGFVSKVLQFFSLGHLMPWFLPSQPLHILYTVISGLFGRAGSYAWKGRNVK